MAASNHPGSSKITWEDFIGFVELQMKQEDLCMDTLSQEHMDHFKALFMPFFSLRPLFRRAFVTNEASRIADHF
eukprot:gene41514-454_t